MIADFVVDVGNSRIKWGRCANASVGEITTLPLVDPAAWQAQLDQWQPSPGRIWVMTGVHPERRDYLANWLIEHRQKVRLIQLPQQLRLDIKLKRPDQVGIDRLLNAVAVNSRRMKGKPAVIVDAGSAVTVDWVDAGGAFRGGSIFPGFRLMGQALNNYTALLPLVEIEKPMPDMPGTSTRKAIEAGIYWAVAGGVQRLIEQLNAAAETEAELYLGGGDGHLLEAVLGDKAIAWPQMTLEGIRLTALEISE